MIFINMHEIHSQLLRNRGVMTRFLSVLTISACLIACQNPAALTQAHPKARALNTLFDYQLLDAQGQPWSVEQAAPQWADVDVLMVGELHGHQGIHRFQADLFASLLHQTRPWALAMEQFSRDHQVEVNRYLAAELGEEAFIKQAAAWPSYKSDYRALLALAQAGSAPVIAANAPRAIVRCIGKLGPKYLSRLTDTERGWVATQLTLEADEYKARFMANRHHGQAPTEWQFAAQTSWDDTMAESMANYLADHPGHGVMLTVGRFHINEGLGTVARLHARNPQLKIAVVYPYSADEAQPKPLSLNGGDKLQQWTLKVAPLPASRLKDEPLPAFSLGEPDCRSERH